MGILRVISKRGDDCATWDKELVAANDPQAKAAIEEAERIFEQQRAKGATAFCVEPGRSASISLTPKPRRLSWFHAL